MSSLSRVDAAAHIGRPSIWLVGFLLCIPVLLTAAFYFHAQGVVQHKTFLSPAQVQAPPAGMALRLERNDGADKRYQSIAGWVVQTGGEEPWLRPSVLVLAPDGQATEFRANLRKRADLAQLTLSERQQRMAGFEVRLKKRYFPRGQPLKIVLAITQQGRRIYVDTGEVVAGTAS